MVSPPQATLEQSHEEELRELEKQYLSRMGQLGAGHRDAQLLNQVRVVRGGGGEGGQLGAGHRDAQLLNQVRGGGGILYSICVIFTAALICMCTYM